jgi:hypothetical protein
MKRDDDTIRVLELLPMQREGLSYVGRGKAGNACEVEPMPRTNEDLHGPLRGHLVNLSRSIDQKYEALHMFGERTTNQGVSKSTTILSLPRIFMLLLSISASQTVALPTVSGSAQSASTSQTRLKLSVVIKFCS